MFHEPCSKELTSVQIAGLLELHLHMETATVSGGLMLDVPNVTRAYEDDSPRISSRRTLSDITTAGLMKLMCELWVTQRTALF